MAVDHTTAGAASGETALAAPKGSQSQAKGQKSIDLEFVVPVFRSANAILVFFKKEIGSLPVSFFIGFLHLRRRKSKWHSRN